MNHTTDITQTIARAALILTVALSSVSISSDGQCYLLSCLDGVYRLFDRDSGALLNSYTGAIAKQTKQEACFDHTDAYVLAGSDDGVIYLWSLVEAKLVTRYIGHTAAVTCVAWHPKSSAFVSASNDGTIRYWT